ncbi:MAG: hypothetical protein MZV65_29250 [Chromatiales bacterium]|nr:hypothetical protein [Chromatiales bacterium]
MVAVVLGLPLLAQAEGDWKRGRVYYRMVCTACHVEQASGAIAPEHQDQGRMDGLPAGRQARQGQGHASSTTSARTTATASRPPTRRPRSSPTCPNRSCSRIVKAFVITGAKDGDAPAELQLSTSVPRDSGPATASTAVTGASRV